MLTLALTTAEWTSVAATAAAAVAAIASLATVVLAFKRDRALHRPRVTASFTVEAPNGQAVIVFTNAGPGLAVGLCYIGVSAGTEFAGYVGNGFLHAGSEKREELDFRTTAKAKADFILSCRDADNNGYLWAFDGRDETIPRKHVLDPKRTTKLVDHFRRMYPAVALPRDRT